MKFSVKRIPWGLCSALAIGAGLRLLFFVGVTGARDDHNEYTNSIYGWAQFPSLTWPSFNRLSIVLPKSLLFHVFGPNEFASVALTFCASIGCIILAYLLGTRLFDREHGLYAALLMAVSPLDLMLSGAPWATDIPSAFYIGLAVLMTLIYSRKSTWFWAVIAGFSFLIAYRGKEISLLVLVPLGYWLIKQPRQAGRFAVCVLGFVAVDALYCHSRSGFWFPDRQAMNNLFGHLTGAVTPLDWQALWDSKTRMLFKSRVLGIFPAMVLLAMAIGPWIRRSREVRFLLLWAGIFLAALIFKPAGWSPTRGLLTVWWDFPRYYALIFIPGTLLASVVLVYLKTKLRWAGVPLIIWAAIGLHSVFLIHPIARIGKNHQEWMRWTNQALRSLPMGSVVMVDQNLMFWLRFKDQEALSDYSVHEVIAENPNSRAERSAQLRSEPLVYVITGGPRGLETVDEWRLDRDFVLKVAPRAELLQARHPEDRVFDDYYRRRDPTEIWKVRRGR